MPVWVVTGKLGAGKTLMSVSRIEKYLHEGRKVATNLDIDLSAMLGPYKRNTELYRLPDIPTIESLKSLPKGYDGDEIDESKNGLLVLDECGIFFDSRNWNDPRRKPINAHFKLLRKLRWDAILIIQDIDNLDSDARRTIAEHVVYCRRMDRLRIPIISWLVKLITTYDLPLPQVHYGIVKYGTSENSMKVDDWTYYGKRLYSCYNTEQLFDEQVNHSGIDGLTRILPPYFTDGRYITPFQRLKNAFKNYEIKGYHAFLAGALMAAFAVNALVTVEAQVPKKGIWRCNDAYKQLFGSCSAKPIAPYEYYFPKPDEPAPDSESSTSLTTPEKPLIYIAGWNRTTRGIYMNFVDEHGKPYFPESYRVRELGDCTARVQINGVTMRLTCMPDHLAYQQPDRPSA
ncbi:MAG: hypothetical protein LAT55_12305 [Opitutales bacterium]|nr:hypothetical protein [Opitutales bacterium]